MYRPFIFCQMMITVDGKINGEFFNDPAYPPAIPVFRECFCTEGETRYPCQAGVFGKNTLSISSLLISLSRRTPLSSI